jgi:hypothetical protein
MMTFRTGEPKLWVTRTLLVYGVGGFFLQIPYFKHCSTVAATDRANAPKS